METGYAKLSSRGQIVIPQDIREGMGLKEGTPFAVSRKKNIIILRAIEKPDMEKEWKTLFKWGKEYAKKKNIKPEDVDKVIEEIRK